MKKILYSLVKLGNRVLTWRVLKHFLLFFLFFKNILKFFCFIWKCLIFSLFWRFFNSLTLSCSLLHFDNLSFQSKVCDQIKSFFLQLALTIVFYDILSENLGHRSWDFIKLIFLIIRYYLTNRFNYLMLKLQRQVFFNPIFKRNLLVFYFCVVVFHFLKLFCCLLETVFSYSCTHFLSFKLNDFRLHLANLIHSFL